jgi:hypothetical protein
MSGCQKVRDGKRCQGDLTFVGYNLGTEESIFKCDRCGEVEVTKSPKRKAKKRRDSGRRGRISHR